MELITEIGGVLVHRAVVSEMQNCAYALTHRSTGVQVLIDAADEAATLERLLETGEREALAGASAEPDRDRLRAIITTHAHWDHVRALAALAHAHPAAALISGADDAEAIERETGVAIARRVEHGAIVDAGGIRLEVIALRGHTPGSIALTLRGAPGETPVIFTGDSLFPGGVGNTDHDPARFSQLLNDVESRLFEAREEATILPGHGDPTTLAAERPHLAEWRERGW